LNKILRPLAGRAIGHETARDDTWHPWWHGTHAGRRHIFVSPDQPLLARALGAFANWALSQNAPGSYAGEDDKRWAYTIETDGNPYLTRILFPRVFGFRPMLHRFHRADLDRHIHNHPWALAFSFILCGSYVETRLDVEADALLHRLGRRADRDPTITRRVRWFNVLTDADYHKVDRLNGEVWTLFVTGKRMQDWGFLVDGEHVPWREYFAKREGIEDAKDKVEQERYDHNNGWCEADCKLCSPQRKGT
jgi:hypothetical protein